MEVPASKLAEILSARGDYSNATPLYRTVMEIRLAALGPNNPFTIESMSMLAANLFKLEEYAEAKPLLQNVMEYQERKRGIVDTLSDDATKILADDLYYLGHYADAEQLYRKSLNTRQRLYGRNDVKVTIVLQNLAETLDAKGEPAAAQSALRQALQNIEQKSGPDSPAGTVILSRLAELLVRTHDYKSAEVLFRRAYEINERKLGATADPTLTALDSLGGHYLKVGKLSDAIEAQRRYVDLIGSAHGRESIRFALALSNLSNVYIAKQDFEHAAALCDRAIEILSRDSQQVVALGETLHKKASILYGQGKYNESERLSLRALALLEGALGPSHAFVMGSLMNLSSIYSKQSRYEEAKALLLRIVSNDEKYDGTNGLSVAGSLSNLALLLEKEGDIEEAKRIRHRIANIYAKALGPQSTRAAQELNRIAHLLRLSGDVAESLDYYREAARTGHSEPTGYVLSLKRQHEASPQKNQGSIFEEAFRVEQSRSATLAGAALSQLGTRIAAGTGALADLVRKEQDMVFRIERLDQLILQELSKAPDQRKVAAESLLRSELASANAGLLRLRKSLKLEFPDYAEFASPTPISLEDVQSLLADDEALVVIDTASESVWAITSGTASWQSAEMTEDQVSAQVKRLRSEIMGVTRGVSVIDEQDDERPEDFAAQAAYRLYLSLLRPVETTIAPKQSLIFVVNGALSSISPAAFISRDPTGMSPEDYEWLIKKHAVTVLPTISSLKTLRTRTALERASKPLRGYANPIFGPALTFSKQIAKLGYPALFRGGVADVQEIRGLPALPETADELLAVGQSVGAADEDIVLGEKATETAVKSAKLQDYRILYFATHGIVAGDTKNVAESGSEPALLLSLPEHPTEEDDGLLTASEAAQLKLNAEWVVLSACNTAAGNKPGAEALSGLASAFFYAGARSVLVSHWPVDSQSAVVLMTTTFEQLATGKDNSPAQSLRKAMLAVMNNPNHPEWSAPMYWAPFILVGEPQHQAINP